MTQNINNLGFIKPPELTKDTSKKNNVHPKVPNPLDIHRGSSLTPEKIKTKLEKSKIVMLENVKKVPYVSLEVLLEKLEPGDIILTYAPVTDLPAIVRPTIKGMQKAIKPYTETSTPASHNFVHAAIYTGNGKISEAVGEGVVTSQLDGEHFKLKDGSRDCFLVVRPANREMAKKAAEIAELVSNSTIPLKYSVPKAIFGAMANSELTSESIRRYLLGAACAHHHILPEDKDGVRSFFCSYFVSWACHVGESKEVIEKINHELPTDERIEFPTSKDRKVLNEWAKNIAKKHSQAFMDKISIQLDPKKTTPQRLYGFILEHPELFTQEMLIIAPEKEMEMTDFNSEQKS